MLREVQHVTSLLVPAGEFEIGGGHVNGGGGSHHRPTDEARPPTVSPSGEPLRVMRSEEDQRGLRVLTAEGLGVRLRTSLKL